MISFGIEKLKKYEYAGQSGHCITLDIWCITRISVHVSLHISLHHTRYLMIRKNLPTFLALGYWEGDPLLRVTSPFSLPTALNGTIFDLQYGPYKEYYPIFFSSAKRVLMFTVWHRRKLTWSLAKEQLQASHFNEPNLIEHLQRKNVQHAEKAMRFVV